MRGASTALVTALLLALQSTPVSAQVVRGRLMGAGTDRPVPGALVDLIDATGRRHGVELSDVHGRFVVRAPQAGIYRLEVRRVGYQTEVSPSLHLFQGDTLRYTMDVAAETIQLAAVVVEEEKQCNLLPELGRETAATWEEARKALDITAWTEARGALRFHVVQWVRELDPEDLEIRSQEQHEKVSVAQKPFRSLPAGELAAGGYVQPVGTNLSYYAPDAEVLLSDTFLEDHCFRLEAGDKDHAELVGLVFEPVSDRELPDVSGVLWLDRGTAELRYLEYRYTNLDYEVSPRAAGGHVGFERLRTGAWIVRRWWIRMPVIQVQRRRVSRIGRAGTRDFYSVVSIQEEGGEVTATFSRRGEQLDGQLTTTLLGAVFDSTAWQPLAGATIRLSGTDLVSHTDRRGAFRIYDVPEGRYTVEFTHPRFEAWNLPLPAREISLRKGYATSVTLSVPPVAAVAARLCPEHPYQSSDGLAVGFVADSRSGIHLPDATVFFEWTQPGARPDAPRAHLEVTTDAQGSYRACGLPPDIAITVWATVLDYWAEPAIIRLQQGAIAQQDLLVDLR